MTYLHIPLDDYDKLLDKDPKHIQMDVCDFVVYLRKKGLSSASISVYVAAVNKFYAMNDIILNWKKIRSFMGEHEKIAEDRPYTHSEIQTIIQHSSIRDKCIVLLMLSGGLRIGAISLLRVKDLELNEKFNIFRINVYWNSKIYNYKTWCTPECKTAIDEYLSYRKRWGERITEESPLFRTDFNTQFQDDRTVKPISHNRCQHLLDKILTDTGIRKPPIEGKIKRSHIMINHGMRKFFEKNAFEAGMPNIYIRRLLGQKSGLEDSYLKLSDEELLEGDNRHVGYVGIIDQLTIDESQRLRKENQILQINKDKLETRLDKLEELYNQFTR